MIFPCLVLMFQTHLAGSGIDVANRQRTASPMMPQTDLKVIGQHGDENISLRSNGYLA
jgi:hypothetical protein